MFSKLDCDSSGEVYDEMMAVLKLDDSRYCSTRAVSSWSLCVVRNQTPPVTASYGK